MKATYFVLVAGALLLACPTPKPVQPVVDADAADDVLTPPIDASGPIDASAVDASEPDVGSCVAACQTLATLGCPEATSDAGGECLTVCVHTLGSAFDLHPACLARATTVDEVRACGSVRCQK